MSTAETTADRAATLSELEGFYGPLIHSYTRADAIKDGALVDITEVSKTCGISCPVALSAAAHALVVSLGAEGSAARRAGNDVVGRAVDVCTMFKLAARRAYGTNRLEFSVLVVTSRVRPGLVHLKANIGPGDDANAVITVYLADESED